VSKKSIKGVIFDLDGTLYTLGWMKLRMSLALLGSLGILRRLSAARAAIRDHTFENKQKIMTALFEEISKRANISPATAQEWYEGQFLLKFVHILDTKAHPRDGLEQLLKRLKSRGVKTAVLSDFGYVPQRLRALRLDVDLFDDLAAAEDFGVLKPSPKPLTALAEKWKLSPDNILMVGDREDMDMKSAKSAGMSFIGITEKNKRGSNFDIWTTASNKIETATTIWSA